MVFFVAGFLTFHVVEKLLILHTGHEEEYGHHHHPKLGLLSATALVGHSLLDGVGIGLAFRVNVQIGLAVAIAVIAHDFADGLNTVSLMLSHKNDRQTTWRYLLFDALAPVVGLVLALILPIPTGWLILFLSFFGGSLLYICAGDILPEAHSKHPSGITLALTVAGVVFIFIVTRLVAF
jgi:ZIP family zinc transporter